MIAAAGYYIFYCINWLVTLLPLRILYIFSDILYPVMYYIIGYRRKVVRTNLRNSFPEKTEAELIIIEKKFYHHLCDLFIETFKLTHLSNKHLMKIVTYTNPEIFDKLFDEGRDVVAILGHFANWEWLLCIPLYTKLTIVSIYKPMHNRHFDNFMNKIRAKNDMVLTPMQFIIREVIERKKQNIRSLYAILSDQTPPAGDIRYRTVFLNQDTPVYTGAEKIASKYDMAVVFFNVHKIKRGRYSLSVEMLFEHTRGLPEHLITDTHVKRLEERIRENPELWIWSHKRWKHKKDHADA